VGTRVREGVVRVRGGGFGECVKNSDWSGWGGEGAVCGNYMFTEPGPDPSHLLFSNSEKPCPAPWAVAIYGSCLQTYSLISSRKPFKL
jgi:hypothetical protein